MQIQQESSNGCGCGQGGSRGQRHGAAQHGCDLSFDVETNTPLNVEAREAVLEALDDEYRARAFYLAVLERFPEAMPFAHIVESEQRHANKLIEILRADGGDIPANIHLGSDETRRAVPASLACACDLAVEEEAHNVSLYESRLLPQVASFPIVTKVFTKLMQASRERHLPTFRRWSAAYRRGRPASR